jgi:Raf kinase inhibitor-like YbhB/YbcL family protein
MKFFIVTFMFFSALGAEAALKVKSTTLKNGKPMTEEQVFNGMGCTGQNVSPDIAWEGAPKNTKYYAVMAHDPDAPTGSGWWHWVIFNIPADKTTLAKGASGKSIPEGAIESRTDFGKPGYGGPCPPPGKAHRYVFKVFALKDKIPLDAEASPAMVGFYANQMKLGEGQITGMYGKKK